MEIQTGPIPGQTPVPADWRHSLIPNIEHLWELTEHEYQAVEIASIKYLFNTRAKWNITDQEFIKQVHFEMFKNVWTWAGKYRTSDTSIGVRHIFVATEVRKCCDDLKYWMNRNIFSPAEMAIRFHHRLVSIHPFVNGNGRHARLIADVIMRHYDLEPFNWGGKILSEHSHLRVKYISAVKAADQKNYQPLLSFVLSDLQQPFV